MAGNSYRVAKLRHSEKAGFGRARDPNTGGTYRWICHVRCLSALNYQSGSCLLMHKRSHPVSFECSITPRSVESQNIIMEAIGAA